MCCHYQPHILCDIDAEQLAQHAIFIGGVSLPIGLILGQLIGLGLSFLVFLFYTDIIQMITLKKLKISSTTVLCNIDAEQLAQLFVQKHLLVHPQPYQPLQIYPQQTYHLRQT
jgi:hypothetical protein